MIHTCLHTPIWLHIFIRKNIIHCAQVQSPVKMTVSRMLSRVIWKFTDVLPDDGGSKHLWNVGKRLSAYTAQHPRRQTSSYSPSWSLKSHFVAADNMKYDTQNMEAACSSETGLSIYKPTRCYNLLSEHRSQRRFRSYITIIPECSPSLNRKSSQWAS
jgi:hypothetical protein